MGVYSKWDAYDKKRGLTLKELREAVDHAERIGLNPEKTVLRTGTTGLKGQVKWIELVEES